MNRRISSAIGFSSSVLVATLAATVMTSNALADDITIDNTPFVSSKTRGEVQAELFAQRDLLSGSDEWTSQHNMPQQYASGYTRDQARSDYIASRELVHAMNGEDSGSTALSQMRARPQAPRSVAMTQSTR